MAATGALCAAADAPDINQAISAYNDAVSNGTPDARTEAARQLGTAIMANPDREDAAVLAYEAGQTLCVYAACEGADEVAAFAAGQPLNSDAIRPGDIALLADFAAWKSDPDRKTRKALDETLAAQVESGASMLSLVAFQSRYLADYSEGDWQDAARSAGEAATHFEPFRNMVGQQWSDARIASITANFNDDPDTEDVLGMARHHVEIGKMSAAAGDEAPAWLDDHWYMSDAWVMAMSAYFHSGGGRTLGSRLKGPDPDRLDDRVDDITAELDEIEDSLPAVEPEAGADNALPFCDGTFRMKPALRYPSGVANRGMFGAVIARVTVSDLAVSDVEILAAVPSQTFEETAEETIRQWRWKVETGKPGETCRASRENIVLPMVFQLGG